MRGLWDGIVDADPIVVGIVILAVMVAAVVYVARRVGRRGGDGAR